MRTARFHSFQILSRLVGYVFSYAQFIVTRMYNYVFHVCLCLLALTFVCNSTYLLKCSFQIYQKSIVVFIRSSKV